MTYWIVGILTAVLVFILFKNSWKWLLGALEHLSLSFLSLLGSRTIQRNEKGNNNVSEPLLRLHLAWSFFAGVILITVPGLYIGKVFSLPFDADKLFWWKMVPPPLIFLVLIVWFIKRTSRTNPSPISKTFRLLVMTSFLTLLAFSTGFMLGGYSWWFAGKWVLHHVKEKVLRAGYSLEFPQYPTKLPDDQNAAYFLKKAWNVPSGNDLFNSKDHSGDKPVYQKVNEYDFYNRFLEDLRSGKLTREETQVARQLIKKHEETFQLIGEACKRPQADWGMDLALAPPFKIELPRFVPFLEASRMLACKAVLDAGSGDTQEALEDMRLGLRMAEILAQIKLLISEMIQVAMRKIILGVGPAVLSHADPQLFKDGIIPNLNLPAEPADFKKVLCSEYFPWNDWKENRGWLEYAYETRTGFEGLLKGNTMGFFDPAAVDRPCLSGFLFALFYRPFALFDQASDFEDHLRSLAVLDLPSSQRKAAYQEWKSAHPHRTWFLSSDEGFNFYSMYEKILEAVAYNRLAHAAVEARLFHRKNKKWPGTAEQLGAGEIFKDPFAGGSGFLRIVPYRKGIVIYSLGYDEVDKQGWPYWMTKNLEDGNIAWVVQ